MMGQIVSVVRQGSYVVGAVRVNEGDGRGPVEYVATVSAVDLSGNPLSPAEIKAVLIGTWQVQRAARAAAPQDLSGQIGGTVNL